MTCEICHKRTTEWRIVTRGINVDLCEQCYQVINRRPEITLTSLVLTAGKYAEWIKAGSATLR